MSFYILGHRGIFWIFPPSAPPHPISAIEFHENQAGFVFICETGSLYVSLAILKLHVDQAGLESREMFAS